MGDARRDVRESDAVYMIETHNGETGEVVHGGGVCIDPRGLLVTVAHIIPVGANVEVSVRARSGKWFENADVLNVNYRFDIAFLEIRKESEEQQFGHINLANNISVSEHDEVFSWLHHNVGFSLVTGKVSYPYSYEDIVFPSLVSGVTIGDNILELQGKRKDALHRTLPFRTMAGITRISDEPFYDLHPDLPLIEVYGFFAKPGSSGSPVFTSMDGTFIGLIMLEHSERNYLLPTDFIIHYMGGNEIRADGLRITQGVEDSGSSSDSDEYVPLADWEELLG